MKEYEAVVICTVFNDKYEFEDNLLIGVAHSSTEARSLLMDDIFRVMEDFGADKCELKNSRSAYDEPITIVRTEDGEHSVMHWHYYCMFNETDEKGAKMEVEHAEV